MNNPQFSHHATRQKCRVASNCVNWASIASSRYKDFCRESTLDSPPRRRQQQPSPWRRRRGAVSRRSRSSTTRCSDDTIDRVTYSDTECSDDTARLRAVSARRRDHQLLDSQSLTVALTRLRCHVRCSVCVVVVTASCSTLSP